MKHATNTRSRSMSWTIIALVGLMAGTAHPDAHTPNDVEKTVVTGVYFTK